MRVGSNYRGSRIKRAPCRTSREIIDGAVEQVYELRSEFQSSLFTKEEPLVQAHINLCPTGTATIAARTCHKGVYGMRNNAGVKPLYGRRSVAGGIGRYDFVDTAQWTAPTSTCA